MADTPPPFTSTRDRLPFLTKLIYGLGDWGNSTTSTIFMFFFAFFLTDIAGIDPIYAAPILLIGGIWDAINDPFIGLLADRIHTRWGRRRPLIFLGALPFSLSFMMMWWIPPWTNTLAKVIYYAIAYILFDTFFTMVSVPYTALTPELTEDYDERTRLNGFRMTVSMAGGLIAGVAAPLITQLFPEKRTGYLVMAIIFGALASVPYFVISATIRERFVSNHQPPLNLVASFTHTFRNRAFLYVAGIYLTGWVTVALAGAMFQYYLTYVMGMANQLEIILGLVQAGALICVPIMVWLCNKMGKTRAYQAGVGLWVIVMMSLAFLPSNAVNVTYFLALSAGLGVAAAHVVPWSIMPDVIDTDELVTGQRREGTYYGFVVLLQKVGSAFMLSFMQWTLHQSHYVANSTQPPSALLAMRLLMGPLPALLLITSMILAWRYPLSRESHTELRARLAAHRSGAQN